VTANNAMDEDDVKYATLNRPIRFTYVLRTSYILHKKGMEQTRKEGNGKREMNTGNTERVGISRNGGRVRDKKRWVWSEDC